MIASRLILGWLEVKSRLYSDWFSTKVSSATIWDVGGNEVGEAVAVEVEVAVAVVERMGVAAEGASDIVVASRLAFLRKKPMKRG